MNNFESNSKYLKENNTTKRKRNKTEYTSTEHAQREVKKNNIKFVVNKQTNWETIHDSSFACLLFKFIITNRYIEKNIFLMSKRWR